MKVLIESSYLLRLCMWTETISEYCKPKSSCWIPNLGCNSWPYNVCVYYKYINNIS